MTDINDVNVARDALRLEMGRLIDAQPVYDATMILASNILHDCRRADDDAAKPLRDAFDVLSEPVDSIDEADLLRKFANYALGEYEWNVNARLTYICKELRQLLSTLEGGAVRAGMDFARSGVDAALDDFHASIIESDE